MKTASRFALPLVLAALVFAGCAQGPGHTRAAGTIGGATAGALIGAAASSPCRRGEGAACGAIVGMIAGAVAAEGVAQDQERHGCCPRCGATAHGCRCGCQFAHR